MPRKSEHNLGLSGDSEAKFLFLRWNKFVFENSFSSDLEQNISSTTEMRNFQRLSKGCAQRCLTFSYCSEIRSWLRFLNVMFSTRVSSVFERFSVLDAASSVPTVFRVVNMTSALDTGDTFRNKSCPLEGRPAQACTGRCPSSLAPVCVQGPTGRWVRRVVWQVRGMLLGFSFSGQNVGALGGHENGP